MLPLGGLCFVENIDIWLVSIFKISSAPLLRTHLNVSLVASLSCVSGQGVGGRVGSGHGQPDAPDQWGHPTSPSIWVPSQGSLRLPCDKHADTQKALFARVFPFSVCIFLLHARCLLQEGNQLQVKPSGCKGGVAPEPESGLGAGEGDASAPGRVEDSSCHPAVTTNRSKLPGLFLFQTKA